MFFAVLVKVGRDFTKMTVYVLHTIKWKQLIAFVLYRIYFRNFVFL